MKHFLCFVKLNIMNVDLIYFSLYFKIINTKKKD